MSQDFIYSILSRPPLGAENLVYKRRVNASDKNSNSKKTGSKEHSFLKGSSPNEYDFKDLFEEEKEDLNDQKESLGKNIDDIV